MDSSAAPYRKPEEMLRYLLEGTSSEIGQEFFRALVRSTAMAMGVAGVWITEYVRERQVLRPMAFWMHDDFIDQPEYSIIGTPCELVISKGHLIHFPDRVIELFPEDADLPKLNAVSYAGVPLFKPDGAILGHLSALDSKPLKLTPEIESVFRIFAARASAEFNRLRAESVVHDSEHRFARLFESAMDAIFELDDRLRIQRANLSAAANFGLSAPALVERHLPSLLTAASAHKFSAVLEDLNCAEHPFAWIAGGLEGVRADGSQFPAEASVSCFSFSGKNRYSVILRNVEQQLAAESRLQALEEETAYLHKEIAEIQQGGEIVGNSPAIRAVITAVHQVASTPANVLIQGETGTGKELVARAIHQNSQRASRPFIRVNCAAIPAALAESEFFGHERGAFTGAASRRVGRFELAQHGVLFLDEVGELPQELQPKLLRVLQDGEFEPVGSSQTRKVDVRVIAATNRDLAGEVAAGRFREDLYYRLNVFPIAVPPLRDRGADLEIIARLYIDRYCSRIGKPSPELTPDCLRRLRSYHWPGNVRELQNVVERAIILSQNGRLSLRDVLPFETLAFASDRAPTRDSSVLRTKSDLREIEKETLLRALEQTNWRVAGAQGAAQALGIPASTLSSRMKALGIKRPH
jgi:formate hydrogenlyase transcriptional activator